MESARDVLIVGAADRNRAVHGDVVAVQLYPEDQWRARDTSIVSVQGGAAEQQAGRPMPTGFV